MISQSKVWPRRSIGTLTNRSKLILPKYTFRAAVLGSEGMSKWTLSPTTKHLSQATYLSSRLKEEHLLCAPGTSKDRNLGGGEGGVAFVATTNLAAVSNVFSNINRCAGSLVLSCTVVTMLSATWADKWMHVPQRGGGGDRF